MMVTGMVLKVLFVVMVTTMVVVMVSCSSPPPPHSQAAPQPHIVLIVADDLGWHDVSWHNPTVLTPHLESLGRGPGGVLLEQSYVQPICTPTRSALLAGRYPYTLGRQHGVLWPEEPTGLSLDATLLPQVLKKVGYSTHAVGKWHLGFCSWDYTPTRRGFDTFYGYYTGAEDYYAHVRPPSRHHHSRPHPPTTQDFTQTDTETQTDDVSKNGDDAVKLGYDFRNDTAPDLAAGGTYSTYLLASYVEQLLTFRSPEDPMFLYLPFQSVHAPLQVPYNYTQPYQHIKDSARRIKLGMVTAMDEAIGRVVSALKVTGHYNNTIIIFTTDNGGPTVSAGNNWPLRGNKTTLWEGGTRGVALVHSPLLPNTPRVAHQLVHVTDWLPTLAGLAGGVTPPRIDGVDQWGALLGDEPAARTSLIYNIDNTTGFLGGIRMGDYKLLVGDPGPGDWTPPPEGITLLTEPSTNTTVPSTNTTEPLTTTNTTTETLDTITESPNANRIKRPNTPFHLSLGNMIKASFKLKLDGKGNNIIGSSLHKSSGKQETSGNTYSQRRYSAPSHERDRQNRPSGKSSNNNHRLSENSIYHGQFRQDQSITHESRNSPEYGSYLTARDTVLDRSQGSHSLPEEIMDYYSGDESQNQTHYSDQETMVLDSQSLADDFWNAYHEEEIQSIIYSWGNTNEQNNEGMEPLNPVPHNNIGDTEKTSNAGETAGGVGGLDGERIDTAGGDSDGEGKGDGERLITDDDEGDDDGRQRKTEPSASVEDEDIQHMTRLLGVGITQIRLFNLAADPEERHNLASSHKSQVKVLLKLLVTEMTHYVPADLHPDDPAGNPRNYGNIWTPGWCHPHH